MNPYIKITVVTFTAWMLTAMINGLLCGLSITIARHQSYGLGLYIIISFFFSLLFSVPGFFIFWITLLISFTNNIQQRALFRTALSAGFMLAAITAAVCSTIIKGEFPPGEYALTGFVILSATISIMMHFKHFKKIKSKSYEARVI